MKKLLIVFIIFLAAGLTFATGQKDAGGPKSLLVAAPPWIQ